ncbi:MAG: hypothetical protein AB7I24_07360 [Candidatus Nanopelagicales bacterium]|jgi:hypothetical protein
MTEREQPGTGDPGASPDVKHWAAADLSRIVPGGTLQQPTVAAPTDYQAMTRGTPGPEAGGAAVVTPLPKPRPYKAKPVSSGLQLGPVGRVIVGAALAATLVFMVYTAWHNIFP